VSLFCGLFFFFFFFFSYGFSDLCLSPSLFLTNKAVWPPLLSTDTTYTSFPLPPFLPLLAPSASSRFLEKHTPFGIDRLDRFALLVVCERDFEAKSLLRSSIRESTFDGPFPRFFLASKSFSGDPSLLTCAITCLSIFVGRCLLNPRRGPFHSLK